MDYLECRNQSCRGYVSYNESQKVILSVEVCSFSGLNGLLDIKIEVTKLVRVDWFSIL